MPLCLCVLHVLCVYMCVCGGGGGDAGADICVQRRELMLARE